MTSNRCALLKHQTVRGGLNSGGMVQELANAFKGADASIDDLKFYATHAQKAF